MAKSQQTYNKKEKEKKRLKKKQEKAERREQRKLEREEKGPVAFEDLIRYVDEDGNLTTEKPDQNIKKKVIKASDIMLGVPRREKVEFDPVREGKVKFFNHEKGYGFILDLDSEESIFVHINNIQVEDLNEGDRVLFETEKGPKGLSAINVKPGKKSPKPKSLEEKEEEAPELEVGTDEARSSESESTEANPPKDVAE